MSEMVTLDWKKLRDFVAKRKPVEVSAGILNDWFWTAATVYEKGKWVRNHRAYVRTCWASPGFKATLRNGDVIEVYAERPETPAETARENAKAERRRARTMESLRKFNAKAESAQGTLK